MAHFFVYCVGFAILRNYRRSCFFADVVTKIGFERGEYNASVFVHFERKIKLVAHCDDFVATGRADQLALFHMPMSQKMVATVREAMGARPSNVNISQY